MLSSPPSRVSRGPAQLLTTSEGDAEIQRAMRAGVYAYLLESMPKAEIIRSVHAGRKHVPAEVETRIILPAYNV